MRTTSKETAHRVGVEEEKRCGLEGNIRVGGGHAQKSGSDVLGGRWLLGASTEAGRHRDRVSGSEAQKEV